MSQRSLCTFLYISNICTLTFGTLYKTFVELSELIKDCPTSSSLTSEWITWTEWFKSISNFCPNCQHYVNTKELPDMNCSNYITRIHIDGKVYALILCHVALFCFAVIGNVGMFLIIYRNLCASHANRVYILLLHMNIADLIVTFEYLPKQIIHSSTKYWYGGDMLCKTTRFFDIFGVSLSSAVLVCMCIDRWLSVYRPFSVINGVKRNKVMLFFAWISAFAISLPQVGIFVVASHPCNELLTQCVARDYIGLLDSRYVLAYTIATALYIYFIPLCVIIYCYVFAAAERNCMMLGAFANGTTERNGTGGGAGVSYMVKLRKAKMKTIRMTWSIVSFFLLCWTPYYAAATLHFIDIDYKTGRPRKNIMVVPSFVLKILYMFATMNSSFNAYVYGYFTFDIGRELRSLKAFLTEKFKNGKDDGDRLPYPKKHMYKEHDCARNMNRHRDNRLSRLMCS